MITNALSKVANKASVYIVTQFPEIARKAQEEYGAVTLQAEEYHIRPGIGSGKGMELAQKEGLTKEFLNDIISQCNM